MEERIKQMYNDCAKLFTQYTKDHDMAKYNEETQALCKKYGAEVDIKGLLLWWAGRVQMLHDVYLKNNRGLKDGRD